jgi:hypothetical protein
MSSKPLLSAGPEAEEAVRLRREIAGLEKELQEAKDQATQAKQAAADAVHAIRALRKQTEPLYMALKMIHGEISRVDAGRLDAGGSSGSPNSGLSPKWQMLAEKLGGHQATFIELLQHGGMTVQQLRAAAHCDITVAYRVIKKMYDTGLLTKSRGVYSLKEL